VQVGARQAAGRLPVALGREWIEPLAREDQAATEAPQVVAQGLAYLTLSVPCARVPPLLDVISKPVIPSSNRKQLAFGFLVIQEFSYGTSFLSTLAPILRIVDVRVRHP